ncbi:unnamed protein product [Amaranthus hypochondriacus]
MHSSQPDESINRPKVQLNHMHHTELRGIGFRFKALT